MPTPALITANTRALWTRLIITLCITLLLGACATTRDLMDDLNKSLRGYEKAIRWAKYDLAYSFHKWEGDAPSMPEDIENFRVTKYETFGEKFNQKDMVMKQTIKLSYYNTDDQRVRSIRHPQEWKFYPESKRWFLLSPPIPFK